MANHYLIPDWPAPENVRSAISLRTGGVSEAPFNSNNLALHVEDNPAHVLANRQALVAALNLPCDPLWLEQVHGTDIVYVPNVKGVPNVQGVPKAQGVPSADGSYTDTANTVCAVLTADCLPVLLCNQSGTHVAAAHAGWRGLCNGILRDSVATFAQHDDQIMAYLGPAIVPQTFEVGAEVLEAFLAKAQNAEHQQAIRAAFVPSSTIEKHLADLYALARAELAASGVTAVYGGEYCTFSQPEQFYSYRRDHKTGRNASLIWLENSN